jgi:hypothetical protein
MTLSRQREQDERQALVGSKGTFTSYRDAAIASLTLESQIGRFNNNDTIVVGSHSGPIYPALPSSSPWHHDDVPPEEPLGYSVEAVEPVGNPDEIAASELAARASTPAASTGGDATTPDGSSSSGGGGGGDDGHRPQPSIHRRKFA